MTDCTQCAYHSIQNGKYKYNVITGRAVNRYTVKSIDYETSFAQNLTFFNRPILSILNAVVYIKHGADSGNSGSDDMSS